MSSPGNREHQALPHDERVKELERRIADLKARWPAHSVPAAMLLQLDELEEELEKVKGHPGRADA